MDKAVCLSKIITRVGSRIVATKVLLSLVAIVLAASISVSSSTYQAEIGSVVNFPTGFLATDKGFSISQTAGASAGTSCNSPVTFGSTSKTANTTIVAGDFVYDIQVNTTGSGPASAKFNTTLVLGSTTYGPLCIQTPASPVSGQTIDCRFDVGTTLPASPYTFKVTIQ
jgi:hypothetical protein